MNWEAAASGIHTGCSDALLITVVTEAHRAGAEVVDFVPPDTDEESELVAAVGENCPELVGRGTTLADLVSGLGAVGWPKSPTLLVIRQSERIGWETTWDAFGALTDITEAAVRMGRRLVVMLGIAEENQRILGVLNNRMVITSRHPWSQQIQPPGSRIPAIDHRYDGWPGLDTPGDPSPTDEDVAAATAWLHLPNSLHVGCPDDLIGNWERGVRAVGGSAVTLDVGRVVDEESLMEVLTDTFHTILPLVHVAAAISLASDLDFLGGEPEYLIVVRGAGGLHGRVLEALLTTLLAICDRMRSGGAIYVPVLADTPNVPEILVLAAHWNERYYTRAFSYGLPDDLRPIPVVDHRAQ